jgi:hypothetical protein
MSVRENFGGSQEHLNRKILLQDAQKGRQQGRRRAILFSLS